MALFFIFNSGFMNKYWSGKKVLVTGGSGFIGSVVVEMLLERGAEVILTSRDFDKAFRFLEHVKTKIELFEGDLKDSLMARKCISGAEVLMHLAADVGGIEYNIKHPGSIYRNNMQIFMNVLEAARLERVGRIMVTSSACVYPRHCTIPTPEREGFDGRPEPTNEGYGWAKRMQEFMSEAYAKEYGMNICIARPYNAYGPRDNFNSNSSHVISALISKVEEGQNPLVVWGSGIASRSFIYVDDLARGLIEVAEKSPQVEAINIGNNEEINIKNLAHQIVQISGKGNDIIFDSKKPDGQPRRCCDINLGKELIGFEAKVSLEEGLLNTIEWYRNNH